MKSDNLAKLLALTADDALARSYADQASAERARADRWRLAAVAVLTSSVGLGAITVLKSLGSGMEMANLIGRVALSAAIAALGGYLQHQASIHRAREERAREAELKLRTIGPYSAGLSDTEASRIRTELALQIFTGEIVTRSQ